MTLNELAPLIFEQPSNYDELVLLINRRMEKKFGRLDVDFLREGLVHVFAHYSQLLIERLNLIPDTHHQAFIDILGFKPLPPIAAEAVLSFKASAAPTLKLNETSVERVNIVVPQYSQVAAPPNSGSGSSPVVFETANDLTVLRAELKKVFAVDLLQQRLFDVMQTECNSNFSTSAFGKGQAIAKAWHISNFDIFGMEGDIELTLRVSVDGISKLPAGLVLDWGITQPDGFISIAPIRDTTASLCQSGEIIFRSPKNWPLTAINNSMGRWLSCRLSRVNISIDEDEANTWQSLPIKSLELSAKSSVRDLPIAQAFNGASPLDVSKDFFPLGERPRFGEVFYLSSNSFISPLANVKVEVLLTNSASMSDSPIPPVSRQGKPILQWEIATIGGWQILNCEDETNSLTESGVVTFDIPEGAQKTSVNGHEGGWIRARLISGNYCVDGKFPTNNIFSEMAPPSIARIAVNVEFSTKPIEFESVIVEANLESTQINLRGRKSFYPFPAPESMRQTLYLGLLAAHDSYLSKQQLSVFVAPNEDVARQYCSDEYQRDKSTIRWQIRGAKGWKDCRVIDPTRGMLRTGIVQIDLGDDIAKWQESTLDTEQKYYWLRATWVDLVDKLMLVPQHVVLNAVKAKQSTNLKNELIGSSTGRPNQVFKTARSPVLSEIILEIGEPNRNIQSTSLLSNNSELLNSNGLQWVRWLRVSNFQNSTQNSHHFIFDFQTGIIRFGDGRHGRIPPKGPNNIRIVSYEVGGGELGNCKAHSITKLRTTIPYVESVFNPVDSAGGQDKESRQSVLSSATARLRHRDRAVCLEDYIDLAKKASPQIAKVCCVSATSAGKNTLEHDSTHVVIKLIVVPRSSARNPYPDFALLEQVKNFLDERRPTCTDIVVLGPIYVRVCLIVAVVVESGFSKIQVMKACEEVISNFLHPIFGGAQSRGWDFGELPHRSDCYSVLNAIDGVNQVSSLSIQFEEEHSGDIQDANFLIYSGAHQVSLCN